MPSPLTDGIMNTITSRDITQWATGLFQALQRLRLDAGRPRLGGRCGPRGRYARGSSGHGASPRMMLVRRRAVGPGAGQCPSSGLCAAVRGLRLRSMVTA